MMKTTMLRRQEGATSVAAGTVPSDGRDQRAVEGAANTKEKIGKQKAEMRTDYMVDDHDPLDARQALAAADLMMSQMKGGANTKAESRKQKAEMTEGKSGKAALWESDPGRAFFMSISKAVAAAPPEGGTTVRGTQNAGGEEP